LKQTSSELHNHQLTLPAKKISDNREIIREIILYRMESGFYNEEIVLLDVLQKLMKNIFDFPTLINDKSLSNNSS